MTSYFPRLALLCAVCLLAPIIPVQASLPQPVARIANALEVDHAHVSVWVQELGASEPMLAHLPDVPRTPASTMKLVSSFAALQGLGPAYRWQTEAYALGPVENGVLAGDLLLRGQGDPYLVREEFWRLVQGIRHSGISRIEGDLVFDGSYYQLPAESPGDFDGRPDRIYNLLPHPLLVNFNAVRFEFEPRGRQVQVRTEPVLRNIEVHNRLQVRPGACAGYQRGIALNVLEPPVRDRVLLEGSFPSGCRQFAMTRSVLEPESYAFGLFEKYWHQLGGEIEGQWRQGRLPATLQIAFEGLAEDDNGDEFLGARDALVHVHRSRPLGELVRLVNKYSNNVMTRHLELTLGAERFEPPATPEKGRAATLEILRQHGIDTTTMVLDNPSGLSRSARLSARQLGQLLQAAWDTPFMPEFVASLALAGLDGTMHRRFRDRPETGRMHLKTGTLDNVSAVAGYVHTPTNRRLIVVVLVNAENAHRGPGEEIQDAVLRWAFAQGS